MEGDTNKKLIPDPEFDRLIPKPTGIVEVIKRNAELEDTIEFLPQAVKKVAWQVKKIAPLFKGKTLEETCRNIWERFYTRIRYCKDEPGKEQIRSPRVTWWGRKGDCDDFTVLISACLCNLGIRHIFRIMMQTEEKGFQHIYPVVITPTGHEIIIDCVLPKFNYEVPYIQKIDKEMELQFLDGVEDDDLLLSFNNIDAEDLLNGDLGELGKRLKDTRFVKKVTQVANKVKDKVKQAIHTVNKVNPATALLRAGVLASMKLNVFNIAGTLRYTYLNDGQAKQKGFNMGKFPKLKAIREKLEKIFHGAGGEISNLKKAILEGKGNQNKEVPLSGLTTVMGEYGEETELSQLLGAVTYKQELMCAKEIGSLGVEPTTSAALAAATTAMAAIAALIKQLGPLKGGDTTTEASATNSTTESSNSASTESENTSETITPGDSADPKLPTAGDANKSETTDTPASATDKGQEDAAIKTSDAKNEPSKNPANRTTDAEKLSAFERAKAWAKENKPAAVAIGVASTAFIAALLIGGYKLMKKSKKETNKQQAMAGVKNPRRSKHKIKIQKLR